MAAALLAVDWGTSSLRGALLDGAGHVLEERRSDLGILQVQPGQFESIFNEQFGDWIHDVHLPCLMAGMAGSRQGWHEAPYCACPAGFAEVARQLTWVVPQRVAIVPGVRCESDGDHPVPDVMRGEETQVFGALQLLQLADALVVLPGTHSKWVQVDQGHITGFSTCMTGELYALLRQHSILARMLPALQPGVEDAFDATGFAHGLERARHAGGLLHHLFGVRTLALLRRMESELLPSYLSGLLIGAELHAQLPGAAPGPVVLVGSEALTRRYRFALEHAGREVLSTGPQATWQGLHAIFQHHLQPHPP